MKGPHVYVVVDIQGPHLSRRAEQLAKAPGDYAAVVSQEVLVVSVDVHTDCGHDHANALEQATSEDVAQTGWKAADHVIRVCKDKLIGRGCFG